MHLWPQMREALLGPVGAGLLVWFLLVVWLGASKRERPLGVLLAITAVFFAAVATGAFQASARAYSPSRDMPLIMSGLFVTFSLAAFVCGSMALAALVPSIFPRRRAIRRIVIQNTSSTELGVMLEPWTDRADVAAGKTVNIEGNLADDEITIDFGDESFLSIWCPPGCKLITP
ncbi:MAG: hypothetical protein JWO81_1119 [Alphaproteobacteria bacterium]|nr:hypothetical protein [Alphaproteobacteria bacterium]